MAMDGMLCVLFSEMSIDVMLCVLCSEWLGAFARLMDRHLAALEVNELTKLISFLAMGHFNPGKEWVER
jgi:hypothetical protein